MASPTYATTSAAIVTKLESVSQAGNVHNGERHVRTESRLKDLFGTYITDAAGRVGLRGWIVQRNEIAEEWWTQTRTVATERWTLTGLQGVAKSATAEAGFQALADRVWKAFRDIKTLGDLEHITAQRTPSFGYGKVAGRLCFTATIELEATCLYTIGSDATPPSASDGAVSDREGYADTADQIADYLDTLTNAGQVHRERRWATTRDELVDLFTELLTDGTTDIRRVVRTWQVYREADSEQRGIGNRVEADGLWKLQAAWSWRDSESTYAAVQAHVDDACALFRQLPNLGSKDNAFQVLSSPLQIREVGGRMLGDVLTHFVDGEISISEVCHV